MELRTPDSDTHPFRAIADLRFHSGRQDRFDILTAIEEASEEGSGTEDQQDGTAQRNIARQSTGTTMDSIDSLSARSPAEIFSRFIMHLGPSMKSLAYTLGKILDELPFGPAPDYSIRINEHFMTSLTDALYVALPETNLNCEPS